MKCQILFSGRKLDRYFKMSSAEVFIQAAKRWLYSLLPMKAVPFSDCKQEKANS